MLAVKRNSKILVKTSTLFLRVYLANLGTVISAQAGSSFRNKTRKSQLFRWKITIIYIYIYIHIRISKFICFLKSEVFKHKHRIGFLTKDKCEKLFLCSSEKSSTPEIG